MLTLGFDKKGDAKPNTGDGRTSAAGPVVYFYIAAVRPHLKPDEYSEPRAPAAGNLPAVPSNEFCQSRSHAQPEIL